MSLSHTKGHLVSIIMPTYNRARFLNGTIQKILSQTYTHFELIILNDCSTDETKSVLEDLAKSDNRIKIIHNDVNLKIVRSLNFGLHEATGYYIARADDDDPWINPKKLENQVNFLDTHPEYMLVGTGAIVVDEQEKELFRYTQPTDDTKIRARILVGNPFIHGTVLFKRSVLEKTGPYDINLKDNEDWDMWLRIGMHGKMHNIPSFDILRFYGARGLSIKNRVNISKTRMYLVKKYKHDYPNFALGYIVNMTQRIYTYLPYSPGLNTFLFKVKRKFLEK